MSISAAPTSSRASLERVDARPLSAAAVCESQPGVPPDLPPLEPDGPPDEEPEPDEPLEPAPRPEEEPVPV